MNIFKHRDSFFSCLDSRVTEDSLLSLFRLAKQIRLRLGKQGYLLDCYLSLILEGLCGNLAYDAADEGFQSAGKLQSLLFHVLDGTELIKPHPLYQRAQEVCEQQKTTLVFQEQYTNLSMLLFPLADEMMADATSRFVERQVSDLNKEVDEIRLQELFDQISHLAGEAMMEDLNEKILKRFLIAPMTAVFAQGFTDDLLCRLTSRDYETSKQMFQLLLDSLPDTP